ncbi:MAG: maleylpyruvate isomerase family mycothiol-dependent enzyme [Aquihabitans sp.]
MTDEKALIRQTFLRWAEELESVLDEQWDAPSLCEGWTVRMVVAHASMAARYDEGAFTGLLAAERFDFGRLSDRLASEDGARSPAELVADLRNPVLHDWDAPGAGAAGALTHVVIHSADTTIPLGLPAAAPPDALEAVLDQLGRGGLAAAFGVDATGRAYRATDLGWAFGDGGHRVEATAAELVALLAGRLERRPPPLAEQRG